MRRILQALVRPAAGTFFAGGLVVLLWFAQTTRPVSADTKPPKCGLAAVVSHDKTSYTLTVTTSGSSKPIAGYTFNFGDHQSYSFEFSGKDDQNRYQTAVTHAYPAPGVYTATAHVDTKRDGKPAAGSSPSCSTTINTGPKTLVDTGAGNPFTLFAIASLAGIVLFQVGLRHSAAASREEG